MTVTSRNKSTRVNAAIGILTAVALGAVGWASAPPLSAQATTTNGNGNASDVGTWFVNYNSASSFANNFGHGFPINYRPLDQNGNYSIPDSSNPALMDFYLGQLASAGIDFILFDDTNGGLPGSTYYPGNSSINDNIAMSTQRIAVWNAAHSWKIKYAFAIGTYSAMCGSGNAGPCAENQAQSVLANWVNNSTYGGSNYYQVDGKPLLVLYSFDVADPLAQYSSYSGPKTASSQFSVRGANTAASGQYGWQTSNGPQINSEVETVSPGWNNHVGSPVIPRANGTYYATSWNTVLTHAHPRIVMISAFNDYNEDTALWTADTTNLDPAHEEKWTGTDAQLHPSMYWDATKRYITALRTTTPANYSLATGGTGSSSSYYSGWPPAKLVDGDASTVFSSNAGITTDHSEWAQATLPVTSVFNTVDLVNRPDAAYGFPKNFQIQVWDGTNWQTRVTRTNYPQPAAGSTTTFSWPAADTTDRVRVLASSLRADDNGNYVLQFAEFAVRNTTATDLAVGASASASSVYSAWPTSKLVDGDDTTAYSSAVTPTSDHTEWVQITLPTSTTFTRVDLVNRSDLPYGFPKNFQIQVWDGTNWQTRVTQTNFAQPAAGATVSFTWGFADTTNQIRVLATSLRPDNNGSYVLQFGELKVYA